MLAAEFKQHTLSIQERRPGTTVTEAFMGFTIERLAHLEVICNGLIQLISKESK